MKLVPVMFDWWVSVANVSSHGEIYDVLQPQHRKNQVQQNWLAAIR